MTICYERNTCKKFFAAFEKSGGGDNLNRIHAAKLLGAQPPRLQFGAPRAEHVRRGTAQSASQFRASRVNREGAVHSARGGRGPLSTACSAKNIEHPTSNGGGDTTVKEWQNW